MKKLNLKLQFDNRGWYIFPVLALELTIAIVTTKMIILWTLLLLTLSYTVFRNQRYGLLLEIFFMIGLGICLTQHSNLKAPHINQIIVNPDQLKLKNDWLSGVGQLADGQKVSFGSKIKANTRLPNSTLCLQGDFQWQTIAPATNKGEFDFQKYYQYQKIYYRGVATHIKIIKVSPNNNFLSRIHSFRFFCLQSLKKLPHWLNVNARSLLLGDFDSNETSLRQGLTNLGIIHIFSISGLHVYLLIDILIKITSILRIPRERVEIALLFILPIFAVIAGSGVGVWRASGLQIIQIIQKHLNWKISKHDCFAIVLLGQTVFTPYVLFSLAGQLSYLLSYGLIVIQAPKTWQRSILINFLSLPLIIFHSYSFSWLTFLANILLTPVFESLIIPITIFSLFIQKFKLLLEILERLFALIYTPVTALANANWTQITIGHLNIIVTVILLGLTLIWLSEFHSHWVKILIVVYCGCILYNHFPLSGQVTIIDIGQGDSILLTTPIFRKTCLIDTGGKLAFGHHKNTNNRVEQITIPYLKYQGITHLDYVFLSHQDADHIGDLHVLLQKFPVRRVCFADGMQNNQAVARQLRPFQQQVQFMKMHLGDTVAVAPELHLKVVWPNHLSKGINEDSLSLIAAIQNKRWLFTGDLNRANELKLFKSNYHIDYLKAGHHGSKTASDPQFLKKINPQLVLISAGRHNRYGHPHPETMANLKKIKIPALNTADHGMIIWNYSYWHQQTWKVFSKENIK